MSGHSGVDRPHVHCAYLARIDVPDAMCHQHCVHLSCWALQLTRMLSHDSSSDHTPQGGQSAGLGGGTGPKPYTGPGGFDEYAGNARVIKAALCAGFYPSILRVEHPVAKFKSVVGGAFQVSSRGPYTLYPIS